MHFVAISKLPEFTEDGEVVPGQCEPYTSSWRLRLVENGTTETLLTGTYYELRRIQRRCISKSPDEVRGMAKEAAASVGKSAMQPQQTGEGDQATQILGVEDVRRAMLQMEAAVNAEGGPAQLDWVELNMQDGMTLASVKSVGETVDTDELGRVLQAALAQTEKGMVVDLSEVEVTSLGLARCLRDLGHRAHLENRHLQIVCPHEQLQHDAYEASAGALKFAPDVETALKAVSPVENLP